MAERGPGPTVRTRVEEFRADGSARHEDRLATEEPLELRLAWPSAPARRIWVTMRTPGDDFDLAAGFVVHEGLTSDGLIRQVAYCTDADLRADQRFNVVTVTLAGPPLHEPSTRHERLGAGSACGVCGKDTLADVLRLPRHAPWPGNLPSDAVVRSLPEHLRANQPVFSKTGGVHAAGLFTADGELLSVREDVGRHNAVDKVVGSRVLAGHGSAAACLVVSGRGGFELVQKAVAAGIGALVAVGAPSSLAVDLARSSGLVLYGFTDAERCVRYA